MSIPGHQELMLPALRVASELGPVHTRDIVGIIASDLGLTQSELSEMMRSGDKPKFTSRVEWAITYLAQAGLVERPQRGYCAVTDRGRETLASDPDRLDNAYLRRFPEFLRFVNQSRDTSAAGVAADDPDGVVVIRTHSAKVRTRKTASVEPVAARPQPMAPTRVAKGRWKDAALPTRRPPAAQKSATPSARAAKSRAGTATLTGAGVAVRVSAGPAVRDVLQPLIGDLAANGPNWTAAARSRWLETFVAVLDYAYPVKPDRAGN